MRSQKQILRLGLVALMLLSAVLTGCSRAKLYIYPIKDTDIVFEGDEETGTVTMTQWYLKNVLDVKLEEGR